ncbi:sigma-70 family RNA polymerase sigma factor [Moorella naiadis]|uniref:sigma-70 family RNA polymerase sigma factor n=1 Tax=Moorella naiadis (nom. illeg.) TaxID=3093670 RepID=UPI003D9CAF69
MELEQLIDQYGNSIMHLAYFYVKDRGIAEDITQETFYRAYKKLATFRGDSDVKTWLQRIAINLCKDYLRSWSWRKLWVMGEEFWGGLKAPHADPSQQVLARDEKRALVEGILQLPIKYREVIVLYYYEEQSTVAIARILNINEGTVRSRLHRARLLLKVRLAKEEITNV